MPPQDKRFSVEYAAIDFPPGLLEEKGSLEFTTNDLAHALFTTGRAPGDRRSHGDASIWEFLHRTSIIPAYIRRTNSRELVRSSLAIGLDRSEKVNLSYSLGQAIAAIFSQHVVSIPFLMHIDRYGQRYGIKLGPAGKRPDLFGYGSNGWVVVEAKGRSNAMESSLPDKIRAQKHSVLSIDGQPPGLKMGCVASFPGQFSNQAMHIDAFDPPVEEIESFPINVDIDHYMLAYYEPFIAALDFRERRGADEIFVSSSTYRVSTQFTQSGLRIGLLRTIDERIRQALERNSPEGLGEEFLGLLTRYRKDQPRAPEFPDGTFVEADWEESISINDSNPEQ